MKLTAFNAIHKSLGAKMVPFAGYEMPIQYEGIIAEHEKVRNQAGLFDVSHMGEFWVTGEQALEFVEYATANNVSSMEKGQVQYSTMCLENGGIVDDLLIYRFADRFLLVVNASNLEKDWNHLSELVEKFQDVQLTNGSDGIALLALQGPEAKNILSKLTSANLDSLDFYHFGIGDVSGLPMIISRTGYTGELGYELYHDPDESEQLWAALMDAGEEYGIAPIGLGARDTLRLEMKFCLYGNDIDETTTPLEARLGWATDLDHEDFLGRDALLKQKETGLSRFLVAFEMIDRGLPRNKYEIFAGDEKVGYVTSGGQSPTLKKGIGLAYIDKPHHKANNELSIDIRGKRLKIKIIKPPFVNKKTS
ncbi:MAG: glycine cleavage system aminomethyltransferase GcvT [Candidatus Marinimicrobia bacterium]|jgi:aminomethyltransferase|nr:glycine cleavage system aminomethyltransferase GcvT [Candidatus Neomarinimicrobiota bacterium]MBT3576053.1 glycine cleavage system aminomethyltransferase GcvT [Candidatus Neomarinimicrobiota bacterium]MBT3679299.1 glycine cleavage system aminomethyltransferase GcvT [Candidatus Neomarinimicrobiota bacterium]MBT3949494.1 glycine cleavage system aminomethyltransferase GcvT [Candidatus Neomarinimicrobiota bacterium]MBT4252209.1 glycine cleavage system aminomethyltransferase GcvT [Candidatus Neom